MKDLHGKWILLTIDSGHCDEACQKKLYFMRQVRLVQGKQKHRIERLWLIKDDVMPDAELVKQYEGTFFVSAKDSEILSFIETKEITTGAHINTSNSKNLRLFDFWIFSIDIQQ